MADLNGIINLMILDVVDLQEANLIETSVRERVFSGIFSDPNRPKESVHGVQRPRQISIP